MLGEFNEDVQVILFKAKEEMLDLRHPYIGTEHLLLSILKNDDDMSKRLKKYNLTYDKFKDEIIKVIGVGSKTSELFLYTPLLKKVISNAVMDSKENNDGTVTVYHLIAALLECGEGIAIRLLLGMDIDVDAMFDEFSSKVVKRGRKKKKLLLDELGVDLNKKVKEGKVDLVIGREKEILRVLEILGRKNKNNPILIGDAGVGKTAIVEEIARMIVNGEIPKLNGMRIISLNMSSVVSGTKYRGEFEEKMEKIINELEDNPDIILFIDEIHTLVGAGGAEGAIDASNILKPALARGSVRCIGATTTNEYEKNILKDKALDRRFQKVVVNEPSVSETCEILEKIKDGYEKYHNVSINSSLINDIVTLSDKYIYDRKRPDRAIDILDEVCSKVGTRKSNKLNKLKELELKIENIIKEKNSYIIENNIDKAYECLKLESKYQEELSSCKKEINIENKIVTREDIASVISNKSGVRVYDILKDDISAIIDLENSLNSEIVGQKDAINDLVKVSKRIKFGFDDKVKSFLFVGPSGVGKTKLSSVFAREMVGSENFIRLDMSEYSDSTSVSKILGTTQGYVGYDDHTVLDDIRKKPNAVILFDEIDKAHQNVINLLYQILDYGKITDSRGNEVRFNHNIIIMTSNVGYKENCVGFNVNKKSEVNSNLEDIFGVSLMNRIDDIILFNKLDSDDIEKIIKMKLDILNSKYGNVSWIYDCIPDILKKSNYEKMGARGIDKIIISDVESKIIDKLVDIEKIKG